MNARPEDATQELRPTAPDEARHGQGRLRALTADADAFYTRAGIAGIAVGFVAIVAAWLGASGQEFVQQQFPYLLSGGILGLAFIILGGGLFVVRDVRRDRVSMRTELARLTDVVESALNEPPTR